MTTVAADRLRIFYRLLPFIILTLFTLNGCAVKHPVQQPPDSKTSPPATSQPSVPPKISQPLPSVQPQKPSTESYIPKTGPAGSLYASAQDAMSRGNYQQAEITLERALRIEPRNAHYWYTMAQVKYKQGQYSQTVHLCSKSKTFAGKNSSLIRLNDSLKQKAKQQITQ